LSLAPGPTTGAPFDPTSVNEEDLDHQTLEEQRATFTFSEHDLPKLREVKDNWAKRSYINAKHLLIEKSGMREGANIPPKWHHQNVNSELRR